jgi:hypothetical protein
VGYDALHGRPIVIAGDIDNATCLDSTFLGGHRNEALFIIENVDEFLIREDDFHDAYLLLEPLQHAHYRLGLRLHIAANNFAVGLANDVLNLRVLLFGFQHFD